MQRDVDTRVDAKQTKRPGGPRGPYDTCWWVAKLGSTHGHKQRTAFQMTRLHTDVLCVIADHILRDALRVVRVE